ncbi:cytochrome P450 [Microthyrium microscopicum]|uniref:Cytochrome P450 n=1 Tax=Microthyrium microscopicum TaxID=703497 RepID=A0A6A6TZ33_9PEZI|nr:cytochrome P450 [Microthyrium microscopicum]
MDTNSSLVLSLIYPLALPVILIILYQVIQPRKWKDTEPSVIPSLIPYIGHPLNLFIQGGRYLRILGRRFANMPVITLPAVTSRIYIVTSPTLAAEVQRKRTLLFDPLVPDLTQRVLGMDAETVALMRRNVARTDGNWGPVPEMHDCVASGLGIGPVLNDLTSSALTELTSRLNAFGASLEGSTRNVDLLTFTKHIYATASAHFLYGPNNPFAVDPSLESAFWDFDAGIASLLIGIFPSITARKPYRGRERLAAAFRTYLCANHQSAAATMIQHRMAVLHHNGFSIDGMARSEMSFLFAAIVNTAISSFWTVTRIFADPKLHAAIHQEITTAHEIPENGPITLNLRILKSQCLLLVATMRETLRLASDVSTTRLATTHTTLLHKTRTDSRTYDLFEGSIVQISGAAMHADPKIWGEDAASFRPERFLGDVKYPGAAFRAFGGGSTLCPGRHLAAAEVLVWTAAMVLGWEVQGVVVPEKDDGRLPVHVCEPKRDVGVKMRWSGRDVLCEMG